MASFLNPFGIVTSGINALIGRSNLDKQRKFADRATNERYDTGYLTEPTNLARETATEGIDEDLMRDDILNSVYDDETQDLERFGVSGSSALAVKSDMEEARSEILGNAESKLQLKDEEVKQAGRERLSNLLSQRDKIQQEREASLYENRMLVEAEAGRRKSALTGTLLNLGASYLNSDSDGDEEDDDSEKDEGGFWGSLGSLFG